MRDIEWFKKQIVSKLSGYEFEYKFFEEGDFGSLNQVEFNSEKIVVILTFGGWVGWAFMFGAMRRKNKCLIFFWSRTRRRKKKKFLRNSKDY